MGLDQ
jgi:alkylation response protein AidB-like acyl-CoA dehydrogenase